MWDGLYLDDVHDIHVKVLHGESIAAWHTQNVVISVLHEQMFLCLVLPLTLWEEEEEQTSKGLTLINSAYMYVPIHTQWTKVIILLVSNKIALVIVQARMYLIVDIINNVTSWPIHIIMWCHYRWSPDHMLVTCTPTQMSTFTPSQWAEQHSPYWDTNREV